MGKRKHARIIVNGIQLYNLGGKTAEQLKMQINHQDWHPLTGVEWPLVLGLKQFKPNDVKFVTILFITRTQGHHRRIDGVHQYWYYQGVLTFVKHLHQVKLSQYNNGKWEPFYTSPQDPMYRLAFNLIDMRVGPGGDMLGWIRPFLNTNGIKPTEKPVVKLPWYRRFWTWICGK